MGSVYWIVKDIKTAKEIFVKKFPDFDIRILIGEKQTKHITVKNLGKTIDGQTIIEIPGTLPELQKKLLALPLADRPKTKTTIKNFTIGKIFHHGLE